MNTNDISLADPPRVSIWVAVLLSGWTGLHYAGRRTVAPVESFGLAWTPYVVR